MSLNLAVQPDHLEINKQAHTHTRQTESWAVLRPTAAYSQPGTCVSEDTSRESQACCPGSGWGGMGWEGPGSWL